MSGPSETTGIDLNKNPHKSLLKRIDIGLMTGLCALMLSLVGVVTSRASFKMAQDTQKARVLPIIDIDMGYENVTDRSNSAFVVRLNNVGAGLAHIQRVIPLQHDKPIEDIQTFDDAIMNRRMRGWITPIENVSTGFLRAGNSIEPRRYRMGAAGSELSAYLNGQFGTPLDGLDLDVCYCSVFNDCWTIKYLDRKLPTPINSCGIKDQTIDYFQNYIDQTAEKRLEK